MFIPANRDECAPFFYVIEQTTTCGKTMLCDSVSELVGRVAVPSVPSAPIVERYTVNHFHFDGGIEEPVSAEEQARLLNLLSERRTFRIEEFPQYVSWIKRGAWTLPGIWYDLKDTIRVVLADDPGGVSVIEWSANYWAHQQSGEHRPLLPLTDTHVEPMTVPEKHASRRGTGASTWLDRRAPIDLCYMREFARKTPLPEVELTTRFVIAAQGEAKEVELSSSTALSSSMETCLRRAISTWRFRAVEGLETPASQVFHLKPRDPGSTSGFGYG